MKKDVTKAMKLINMNVHYDIEDGFNSAMNGANIVVNRAKKLTIPKAVDIIEILKRC